HKEVRDAVFKEHAKQLQALFNGRITVGKSNTAFDYGVYLNATPLKNDKAPVKLRVDLVGSAGEAKKIAEESAAYLDTPEVRWVLAVMPGLEDRLRRAIAIERLENDEEYRRVATERTRAEAARLQAEADELRRNAAADVERAFQGGTLYWAGNGLALESANGARAGRGSQAAPSKTKVEEALRDRISAHYYRFAEGDRTFNPANVEKLFTVAAADRAGLDADV
ncbi:MAG: hypothetical protein HYY04_01610, partial [Chloroflexi bacterium]|nr:hypothetical protein [Chloroflexota bacterium]